MVLVSGLSGAGKASILRALEDLGYDAVDNPPLTLVETLVSRADGPLAIGLDARSRGFDAKLVCAAVTRLKAAPGLRTELVYAWAEEAVLLRRYTETRRRHPLAPHGRVIDGIHDEDVLTRPLRNEADLVLDTSELPLAELRLRIEERFRPTLAGNGRAAGLTVAFASFAFPAGLPRDADMVFDARFLRNPHYDPILRPGTGLDADVAAYIEADPDFERFVQSILDLLRLVIPRFVREGKKYATIAVGCTGGRHRSVHIVERLARELKVSSSQGMDTCHINLSHRELARMAVGGGDVPSRAPLEEGLGKLS